MKRASSGVSDVRFTLASRENARSGVAGFVSFRVGHLRADGVVLRKTRSGRWTLSFPCKRDRRGTDHPYLRPVDDRARRAIERAVLAELGVEAVR